MSAFPAGRLAVFDSEEAYAQYRASENDDRASCSGKTESPVLFRKFALLPTEIKLEIISYVDCFSESPPSQLAALLFAFSDRSFRPSVIDIVRALYAKEARHFPLHLYRAVELSWREHGDSQWLSLCHHDHTCFNSSCPHKLAVSTPLATGATHHIAGIAPCGAQGLSFRWLYYLIVHRKCLDSIERFIGKVLRLEWPNLRAVLLRLWPYLPTENSIGPGTVYRRQRQLNYLAKLSPHERVELDRFLNKLCFALCHKVRYNSLMRRANRDRRINPDVPPTGPEDWLLPPIGSSGDTPVNDESIYLVKMGAYEPAMKHFLLSTPIITWTTTLRENATVSVPRPLGYWLPSTGTTFPRTPAYEIDGIVPGEYVVLTFPSHIFNWPMHDSLSMFEKAVSQPDGRALNIRKWVAETLASGERVRRRSDPRHIVDPGA
ncbi:hypothetical protein H2201_002946 [Coniosporium apollinis]|uniref:F-box domain-containing protein n=1 Tax=Coniosporium apollinis TaxID=61459 RepID=A0ABQ9NYL6_9PEZI|nr:hypothetical protein H2201_002946 [Coniosporium apollinis]